MENWNGQLNTGCLKLRRCGHEWLYYTTSHICVHTQHGWGKGLSPLDRFLCFACGSREQLVGEDAGMTI